MKLSGLVLILFLAGSPIQLPDGLSTLVPRTSHVSVTRTSASPTPTPSALPTDEEGTDPEEADPDLDDRDRVPRLPKIVCDVVRWFGGMC